MKVDSSSYKSAIKIIRKGKPARFAVFLVGSPEEVAVPARVLAHIAEFLVYVRRNAPGADPLSVKSEDFDFDQGSVYG